MEGNLGWDPCSSSGILSKKIPPVHSPFRSKQHVKECKLREQVSKARARLRLSQKWDVQGLQLECNPLPLIITPPPP